MSFFVVVSLCRFNQINAISLACSSGLEDCNTLTTGWFRELMKNPTNNTWVQSATFTPSPLVFLSPPFTSTLFCPSWHFLHSEISNFPAYSVCCVLLQYFWTWITLHQMSSIVPGLIPTWGPLCTAMQSKREERRSGTLPGPCTKTLPLLPKRRNSCTLWPARQSRGCSTGKKQ